MDVFVGASDVKTVCKGVCIGVRNGVQVVQPIADRHSPGPLLPIPSFLPFLPSPFLRSPATAEPAADVASFLVPRIRAVPATAASPLTGALQPVYIRFLTQGKALQRVAAVSGGLEGCAGGAGEGAGWGAGKAWV